jgi:hypothetical protein
MPLDEVGWNIDFSPGRNEILAEPIVTERFTWYQFKVVLLFQSVISRFQYRPRTAENYCACFPGLLNYLSRAVYDLLGHSDEFAIFLGLSFVPFLGRHPLNFLHPTPCRPRAIAKPLDTPVYRCG